MGSVGHTRLREMRTTVGSVFFSPSHHHQAFEDQLTKLTEYVKYYSITGWLFESKRSTTTAASSVPRAAEYRYSLGAPWPTSSLSPTPKVA